MSEFDFDELDRAVSTLMDKATAAKSADDASSSAAPSSDDSSAPVSANDDSSTDTLEATPQRTLPTPADDIHHTVQSSARPSSDEEGSESNGNELPKPDDEPVEESTENSAPEIGRESDTEAPENPSAQSDEQPVQDSNSDDAKQKVIPHRTGRFMDMKTSASTTPSPAPRMPSRQGVTLSPTHDDIQPEEPQAAESSTIESEHTFETAKSDFPDPIDMMNESSNATSDESSEQSSEVSETSFDEKPSEATAEQPELGRSDFSAFLSNVKPEKRPLGAAIDGGGTDEQPSTEESPVAVAQPADPMEDEFDNRLMAIESGNVEKQLPAGDEDATEADTVVAPKPAETTPLRPTGPISIPQQYDEQPSSGPENNGAIFDTAAYHQPLEHPAKKSNGLLRVVLIVVVILVVGGAAGAAFYFGHL